jgi:hypothetical protein
MLLDLKQELFLVRLLSDLLIVKIAVDQNDPYRKIYTCSLTVSAAYVYILSNAD